MRPKKQQARVVFKHDEYNTRVLLVLRLEQHLFGALLHRLQRAETRRGAVFQRAHDQQQAAAVCDDDAAVRVVRRESNVSQTNARERGRVVLYKRKRLLSNQKTIVGRCARVFCAAMQCDHRKKNRSLPNTRASHSHSRKLHLQTVRPSFNATSLCANNHANRFNSVAAIYTHTHAKKKQKHKRNPLRK